MSLALGRRRFALVGLVVVSTVLMTSPGGATTVEHARAPRTPTALSVPLATSVQSTSGSWVTLPMGHLGDPLNTFWQLFFRPSSGNRWSNVVEGTGVATNGGLVLAPEGGSLLLGVLPSNRLHFSPVLSTANGGRTYSPGPVLMSGLARRPEALSASTGGRALAVVSGSGGTEVLQTSPGQTGWQALESATHLEATAVGRSCGVTAITSVAQVAGRAVLGAACENRGTVGVFVASNTGWELLHPTLPRQLGTGRVEVIGVRQVASGLSVLLAVSQPIGTSIVTASTTTGGSRWTISPALRIDSGVDIASVGPSTGPGWFVLMERSSGSKVIEATGSAAVWSELPTPPAYTSTVAFGPGANVDAMAADGSVLTVWKLTSSQWAKAQVVHVAIEYGSSS
jgi:hypothetical protein